MKAACHRSLWIARITFLEAIRQRFFAFLFILGAALVLASGAVRVFDFGHSELKFLADFGFGGLFLFGSILGVVMTAQLFFAEIDNRTALTLLAKPLSRAEFLAGKFLGIWAVLGVFVLVLAALLAAMLGWRAAELAQLAAERRLAPPECDLAGLALYAALQWLRLGVVVAMVLAVAAAARTFLFAVVVGALAVLAGQLQWLSQELLLKPAEPGLGHAALWLLTHLLPNLQQFNLGDALVLAPHQVTAGTLPWVFLSGVAYVVAFLVLATFLFRRREI
jgi:ABC-type transport system involved in multi-copper enzyme maturation permease subunit